MEDFSNRLKKNFKQLSKWAKRNGISCYRLYDHDIPEHPFCVDVYEDDIMVSAYLNRNSSLEHQAEQLGNAVDAVAATLKMDAEKIFVKQRRVLARREEQYEKVGEKAEKKIVQENGLKFLVNLSDYLDTGLFLDHRPLRTQILKEAAGKHVLNLFAYTGSFSVYAEAAGALSVKTVDLSATYLQWAKENFQLNGFDVDDAQFVQTDVMNFLKEPPAQLYDLVIVDPPSFSNSKRMKGTWDTQRDHATMLHFLTKHCNPGAVIYFSNNFRNFIPDFSRLRAKSSQDISLKTIPEDFRDKRIHNCFKIEL